MAFLIKIKNSFLWIDEKKVFHHKIYKKRYISRIFSTIHTFPHGKKGENDAVET